MKKQNEHGSTAVVAIVVLVLVGVVGFAAFRVGQAPNEPQKPAEAQKWEDKFENQYHKKYVGDSRFEMGSGYSQIYKNDTFGYQYSFSPDFATNGPERHKFVSESEDKSHVVFDLGFKVEIFGSKAEKADYTKCRTEKMQSLLASDGFTEQNTGPVQRDTEVNYIPTRFYFATKPRSSAVGQKTELEQTRIIASTPYKDRCINITYTGNTQDVNDRINTGNDPALGPASYLKLTD